MSRLAVLFRHPRRSLAALATLLVAGAVVVGSGAVFATQTANPSNAFASGILSQSNSGSGSAVLTASQLIPGSSKTGTVDIANTGTVSGVFSLAETDLVDQGSSDGSTGDGTGRTSNKLSGKLNLVIQDCGLWTSNNTVEPTCPADSDTTTGQKYDGTLGGVGSSVALGSYAAGDKHRYKFLVTFPNGGAPTGTLTSSSTTGTGGDNLFSGAFTSATFQFNSTSS